MVKYDVYRKEKQVIVGIGFEGIQYAGRWRSYKKTNNNNNKNIPLFFKLQVSFLGFMQLCEFI